MDTATAVPMCVRHPQVPVDGTCSHCGTPICRECRNAFGYFCGAGCVQASRRSVTPREQWAQGQAARELQRAKRLGRLILAGVGLAVLIGAGWIVWRHVLFPIGRVCWRCPLPGSERGVLRLLGRDGDRALVLSGDSLVRLDPRDGHVVSQSPVPKDLGPLRGWEWTPGGLLSQNEQGTAYLPHGGAAVARYAAAGSAESWVNDPSFRYGFAVVGPDRAALLARWRERAAARNAGRAGDAAEPERCSLVAVELAAGKELWNRPLKPSFRVTGMAAAGEHLFAVYAQDAGATGTWILCAHDAASGRNLWNAALAGEPGWGPECCPGAVLLFQGDRLLAYGAEDGPSWELAVPEGTQIGVGGGLVWQVTPQSTTCIEPTSGKPRWQLPYALEDPRSIRVVRGSLIAFAAIPNEEAAADGGAQLPAAYREMGDVMKEFGFDKALQKANTTLHLVALDPVSGRERWRVRNVYGKLFCDDERIVAVGDTSMTSMLQVMTGGKGTLVLQQLSPKSGKRYAMKKADVAVGEICLIGDRLVCSAMERREQVGLMHMAGGMAPETGAPRSLGIVGFRLR